MAYEQYRSAQKRILLNKHARWRIAAKELDLSHEAKNRLEWMIYYQSRGMKNASLTARRFGIARSTFCKWKSRFNEMNLHTLESRSRAPRARRQRNYSPQKDQRVIALRKRYPYFGKEKLARLYQNEYGERITSWYIQRVIEHYKLYYKKPKKAEKRAKNAQVKKRIAECKKEPRAGFLLHLDTIVLHLGGVRRYILTAVDDHSRLAYARMYKSHGSAGARDFFKRLYFLLSEDIQNVHTDNGSEFHKYFDKELKDLNLPHFWSRARTPKDNPANERFNRTLKEEFLYQKGFHPDPNIFNRKLTDWLVEYNAIRPHQSLDYLTPLEYARQTMGLSTMWSSSTLY